MTEQRSPTKSELKILQFLWENGPCTVREAHEAIGAENGISYTTILKQLQIMHDKQLVRRETSRRAHVYEAVTDREQTQQAMLSDFMSRVYQGSASRMVLQALGQSQPASRDELEEIERLVQTLKQNDSSRA